MSQEVNEVYFFHGTNIEAAKAISKRESFPTLGQFIYPNDKYSMFMFSSVTKLSSEW